MSREQGSIPYFAYGSNNSRQLTARVEREGSGLVPRPAVLRDWTRVFGGWSGAWGGSVASVTQRSGDSVYGVLYMLTAREVERLDKFERVSEGWYTKETVEVLCGDTRVHALVYVMGPTVTQEFHPPTEAYLCSCWRTRAETWQHTATDDAPPIVVRRGDATETVHSEWLHPGFAALGLKALLVEVGLRQDVLWTLPGDVVKAIEACSQQGVETGADLVAAGGLKSDGASEDTCAIEAQINGALETMQRLLQLKAYELA